MRIAAGILGILGALMGGLLGLKWYSDINSETGKAAMALMKALGGAGAAGAEFAALEKTTYALLACAAIGLVVSVMIFMKKGSKMVNAALLIIAGVVPVFFNGKGAVGILMVLGGIFALLIKQPGAAAAPSAAPVQAPPA